MKKTKVALPQLTLKKEIISSLDKVTGGGPNSWACPSAACPSALCPPPPPIDNTRASKLVSNCCPIGG